MAANSPAWSCLSQSSHPPVCEIDIQPQYHTRLYTTTAPSVSVLISHLLLHLGVCEDLDAGTPGLCVCQLPHWELHSRQGGLTEKEMDTHSHSGFELSVPHDIRL